MINEVCLRKRVELLRSNTVQMITVLLMRERPAARSFCRKSRTISRKVRATEQKGFLW